ncbi:ankyrin repeat domain-containing protein [Poseidonibacter antarcticus]|uniref:ankyrin repeat domain-containing protein n=1 Tax=Poseidonibacter antarcticus TaxID=2478538 RepID=UPI000EF46246|nr:ankyrin repeat domain-containing protein [Poseidonibacter antarcticus]
MNTKFKNIVKTQNIKELNKFLSKGGDLSKISLTDILIKLYIKKISIEVSFIKELIKNNIDIYSKGCKTISRSSGIKIKFKDESSDRKKIKDETTAPTSLMIASLIGNNEIVKLLLDRGCNINVQTKKQGLTAFMFAVVGNNINTIKLLKDRGADIFEKAKYKIKILETDPNCEFGIKTKIKEIKDIEVSSFGMCSNIKIIKMLIDYGFNPNEKIRIDNLKRFLAKEISDSHRNALFYACKESDLKLAKLLIKKGNFIKEEYLVNACKKLDIKMIRLLVDSGVDVNIPKLKAKKSQMSPLSIVCSKSNARTIDEYEIFNCINYFIQNGADLNLDSPLMSACSLRIEEDIFYRKSGLESEFLADVNLNIVSLLIKNGADVNFINQKGKSILMNTTERTNGFEVAKILIKNDADVNHKDKLGNNVIMNIKVDLQYIDYTNDCWDEIHEKIEEDYNHDLIKPIRIINLLLDNGTDINAKNNMGMTALMKYSFEGNRMFVKTLLERGADINVKSEMTAYDLALNTDIKNDIDIVKNNTPQNLVKILSNFTIDKPIKYTTHTWDFGELQKEYGNFDGYMKQVKKQFESMKTELEILSPNLYEKVNCFLMEKEPSSEYNWCSKAKINIGWSSLDGLKEHCDSGKNPFDFKLPKPVMLPPRKHLSTFGDIINLFKQEIELRADFNNLETIFKSQNINLDLSSAKLSNRQFYTDTSKFSQAISKIFDEIKKREELKDIEVTTKELEDRSIEIKISHIDSKSSRSADELLQRSKEAGDIADIVSSLQNLCDYSIESRYEDTNFRVNFLYSNNVKDIIEIEEKPKGFTHILRFYK